MEGGVCLGLGSDATHPQIAVAFDFLAIIINIPERLTGIHLLDFIHDKHGGTVEKGRNPSVKQLAMGVIYGNIDAFSQKINIIIKFQHTVFIIDFVKASGNGVLQAQPGIGKQPAVGDKKKQPEDSHNKQCHE